MKWQYYWTDSLIFCESRLEVYESTLPDREFRLQNPTPVAIAAEMARETAHIIRSSVGGPLIWPMNWTAARARAGRCRTSDQLAGTPAYAWSVEATLARLLLRSCSAVNPRPQTAHRQYVEALATIAGPSWLSARLVRTNSLSHSGHCR
jgi:hypothetical protein